MEKICGVCGNKFVPSKYAKNTTKYCSRKCSRHAQHFNKLEENRARNRKWYQENRESEITKNKEYRKQNKELFDWYHDKDRFSGKRETILKRDNNQCVVCGSVYRLSIHHIDNTGYATRIKGLCEVSNNGEDNLITLCGSCHHKLHWWQRKHYFLSSRKDIVRTMARVIEVNSKSWR